MSYNELKMRGTADFPIELYHLTENSPKYNMAYHWHNEIEIIRVISGTLCLTLNNCDIKLCGGDVAFINSEVVHGAVPKNCIYECVVFNVQDFSSKSEEWQEICDGLMSHELYITDFFYGDTSVAEKTTILFEELKKQDSDYSRLSCLGALFCLFGELVRNNGFLNEKRPVSDGFYRNEHKLKRVLSFIRDNFDKNISLSQMASVCEMSPKYFCAYFKRMTKMSPTEYLRFYRVERSARMLLKSELSITEIAFACGFSDLSYFIKVFKAQTGVSPGKFRSRTKG